MRALILGCAVIASGAAVADSNLPSTPTGVSAAASDNGIRVEWSPSSDNVGVAGYNVYRDGSYRVTVRDTRYMDYGVDRSRSYTYQVVAFDDARNYTPQSAGASASVGGGGGSNGNQDNATAADAGSVAGNRSDGQGNSDRPGTPQAPGAAVRGDGGIDLSWPAAGGNVEGYNVYRNGRYVVTVKSTGWSDGGADAGRERSYYLVAFSSDGRFSEKSPVTRVNGGESSVSAQPSDESGSSGDSSAEASNDSAPEQQPQNDARGGERGGAPDGYSLVFSDEFRGNSIDRNKWNTRYRWGPNWVINNEMQYYVDVNDQPDFGYSPFSFDGENMTISASRTPDGLRGAANSQPWVSGALTTYRNFTMKYGYVEMRAKMPRGKGMWPAFWLLHQSQTDQRPEIDVVELLGRDPGTVYQTYHWYENSSLRSTPSFRVQNADYAGGFHTYGMRWEPGKVTWYVDGRETNRFENGNVSSEDMYLLLNLAVGGNWAGTPDGSTPDKVGFTIDYIRAYRR